MADDKVSAALSAIRERNECRIEFARYTDYTVEHHVAEGDVRRLLAVVDAAVGHHQPEQLHAMVEDFKGNVVCPHGPDYDGDLHYEADGEWYCKALPTVVVCSSCCDGSASDLREQWPCPTYTGIAVALTGKAADHA